MYGILIKSVLCEIGVCSDVLVIWEVEVVFVDDECVQVLVWCGALHAVEDPLEKAGEGRFAAARGAGYTDYHGFLLLSHIFLFFWNGRIGE